MSDQRNYQSTNCHIDLTDWQMMHKEFHELIESINNQDLKRETIDTRWKVGEIIEHMVESIEYIPQEIKAAVNGKNFLNLPKPMAEYGNLFLVKFRARKASKITLLQRYDHAFQIATEAWTTVQDQEWTNGAYYFGEGYRTLRDLLILHPNHFREHAEQIRISLK